MGTDARRSGVFAGLLDMLLNEDYKLGDALPTEAALVERFGCSRNTLREAFKQLQTLELVSVKRGVGTFVGPLTVAPLFDSVAVGTVLRSRRDPRAFQELLETRVALDIGMADPICAEFGGREDPELDRIVHEMEVAAERDEGFVELDKEFHRRLQGAVHNGFALDLVMNFWNVFGRLNLDESIGRTAPLSDIAKAHRALLNAAYSGDPDTYRAAVRIHYEPSLRQAELFAKRPPLVEPSGRLIDLQPAAL